MGWSHNDVYEFIKMHDTLNFKDEDDINEINIKKNNIDDLGKLKETDELINIENEFVNFGGCNKRTESRKEERDEFEAVKVIREAVITIHKSLLDIEKNRICEAIMNIEEGIRHTKEGVTSLVTILNRIFLL